MTIRVEETLSDGIERLATPVGAVTVVAVFLMQQVTDVAYKSFLSALAKWALAQTEYTIWDLQMELQERGYAFVWQIVDDLYQMARAAGVELPFPVAVLLLLATPMLGELVYVVGVRALAVAHSDDLPVDRITDGLGTVFLKSFLAGVASSIVVVIGLLFLLVPGLVLAVLLLFVRQRVALAGDGVFESLSNSIGIVRANAGPMLAIAIILAVVQFAGSFAIGFLSFEIIQGLGSAVVTAFILSVVTSAFLQADPDASI